MDIDIEKVRRAYSWAKGAQEHYQKKRTEAIQFCDVSCKHFTLNGQKKEDLENARKYDALVDVYTELDKTLYGIEITLSDALGIDPDAEATEATQ